MINFIKGMVKLQYLVLLFLFFSCRDESKERNKQKEVTSSNYKEVIIDSVGSKMIWLGGEDGGNWFLLSNVDSMQNHFLVKRFFEDKTFYSEGIFVSDKEFDPEENYRLLPLCTDMTLTILHKGDTIKFSKVNWFVNVYACPHNSPNAFSENRVIDGIESEGLDDLNNRLEEVNSALQLIDEGIKGIENGECK